MAKLDKDFFTDNEVLFVGYSSRNNTFCKEIYRTFSNKGIKVYPLNNKPNGSYDIKVYNDVNELPKVPKCAYVLLNKDNTKNVIKQLADSGVKKILFHSKKTVTPDTLNQCKEAGVETAVACPMMILGSGIHRIHAFFAGVR